MQKSDVERQLRRVLCDVFAIQESALPEDPDQSTVVQWDSLGHIRLILRVEAAFSVRFPTAKISRLNSLRALRDELSHEPG